MDNQQKIQALVRDYNTKCKKPPAKDRKQIAEEIFLLTYRLVPGLAEKKGLTSEQTNDAIQEWALKLLDGNFLITVDPDKNILSYFINAIKWICLGIQQKDNAAKRNVVDFKNGIPADIAEVPPNNSALEEKEATVHLQRLLYSALSRLPPEIRKTMGKRLQGLDGKQTADNLGISPNSVYTHHKKALRMLSKDETLQKELDKGGYRNR